MKAQPKPYCKRTDTRVVAISILTTGASGSSGRTLADELKDEFELTLTTRTGGNLKSGMVPSDLSDFEHLGVMFDGFENVVYAVA